MRHLILLLLFPFIIFSQKTNTEINGAIEKSVPFAFICYADSVGSYNGHTVYNYINAQVLKVENSNTGNVRDYFYTISTNPVQLIPSTGDVITQGKCLDVIAVEQYCAVSSGTNGNLWAFVYKGSYADYLSGGGDPNGVDLGTFQGSFDGWTYIALCSPTLPDPVDGWEWEIPVTPIYAHNGGNTYGECILVPNGNTFPDCGQQKIEIEKIKYSNDSVRYVTNDTSNKWLIDFDITGYTLYSGSCNENTAKSQASYVRCYKVSGGGSSYADTDNGTDIDFSMNTTEMKYNSDGGDGSDVFTQAIRDCILSGSVAVIQFTDFSGNVYVFEASGITVDAGASGIGNYLFSGTGQASGAAKVKSATLQCGGTSSGTAVLCFACGKSGTWYDIKTGDTLSEIQVDGLFDCDKECLTESFQLVQCLIDPLPTYGLLAGDYVLYIFEKDCDNIVISSNWYTVDGLTVIEEIPNVEQCDPQPQIQDIEICFKDSLGVEWKKIAILNGTTIISQVYIKVSDLSTGTPTGLQTSWTSCDACVDWEYKSICVLFNGKGATKKESTAKVKSTASLGQVLEVCRKEFRDCKTGKFLFYEYEYLGKIYTQTLFDQLGLKQVKCTAPDVKYQPTGDPQCFTSGSNYVYCQLYTDEANVNNTIRTYSYATGGVIADTTGLNLVPCPVGTITSTTTNYWAGAGQEYPYCSQAIVTCVTNVPLGTTKCDTLVDGVVHTGGNLTLNDWSTTYIECPKDTLGFVCTKEPCDSNQYIEAYDVYPTSYTTIMQVYVNNVPANGAFYSGSILRIDNLFSPTPYGDQVQHNYIVMTGTASYHGGSFQHDFANEGSGAYEATVTHYMRSGNVFINRVTFFWNRAANAFINVNWSNTTYGYDHCDRILKRVDCKGNNLGYYNADGTARTIIGVASNQCPELRTAPPSIGNSYPIPPLLQTLPVVSPTYSQNRTTFAINTIPASYVVAIPANTREITVQNITGTDFTIATSLGTNTVGTRSSIVMSDPINTTISHVTFSGNLTITALGNVGGNISGQAPRVIVNFKSY